MKLYYAPGACSLADHIALIEAGLPFEIEKVDLKAKRTESGADYREINPKGYVPALALDDGEILTENIAALGLIAERSGHLGAAPGMPWWRLTEMLAFISTELHKSFGPIMKGGSEKEQQAAKDKLSERFAHIDGELADRDYILGDTFTVADCYLFVMLMWADKKASIALPDRLATYYAAIGARPGVLQALAAEGLG